MWWDETKYIDLELEFEHDNEIIKLFFLDD